MLGVTQDWWCWGCSLAMGGLLIASSPEYVFAQITPDGTLPNNSIVIPDGSTLNITGGTQAGSNLFHSFSGFSVPDGGTAFFNNTVDIQNIISRVTGGSVSNVDGIIRANGTTNLFLINPNGIIFGQNARLNIGGSFIGSTASSLRFGDGFEFSTTNFQSAPLLTISVPTGLQYGASPSSIQVKGNGQGVRSTAQLIDTQDALRVASSQALALVGGDIYLEGGTLKTAGGRIELGSVVGEGQVSLIPNDKGFALGYDTIQKFGNIELSQQATVDASGSGGGDVHLVGKRVTLKDGSQIEASTLGEQSGGTINITALEFLEVISNSEDGRFPSGLFTQVYPGSQGNSGNLTINTQTLLVQNGARVNADTFGTGNGGNLTINTQTLLVQNGARVSTGTFGTGNGGNLAVNANTVELISVNSVDGSVSSLSAQASRDATGKAGNLIIDTQTLRVLDGAQLNVGTSGAGNGGNLTVNADSVELIGVNPVISGFSSGLFAQAEANATGNGGNLTIDTQTLLVRDGARVSTGTFGTGNGGNLTVNANTMEIIGVDSVDGSPSELTTRSDADATGSAGDLIINTQTLRVLNGSLVAANTLGAGKGGSLTVNADTVELMGATPDGQFSSVLSTSAATGAGGDLTLKTRHLIIRDGSRIQSGAFGVGQGGNLAVTASESVELSGTLASDSRFASGLIASVQPGGTGAGGNLTLQTRRLSVQDGAAVSTGTFGEGSSGILSVNASESIELKGTSVDGRSASRLSSRSLGGGDARNLTIQTGQLSVRDGGAVNVSSERRGNVGSLVVNANSINLDRGKLVGTTASGRGGDISLQVKDLVLMRNDSTITTTAGTAQQPGDGGNININTPNGFIIAVPNENSDITANAFSGNGGKIAINTTGIYGIAPLSREDLQRLSPDLDPSQVSTSDITAISQTNPTLSGTIELNTLGIDPNSGLIELPTVPVDTQVAQGCYSPGYAQNRFVITGRGGLPANPKDILTPDAPQIDWVSLKPSNNNRSLPPITNKPTTSTPKRIVEATGAVLNAKGQIVLTANSSNTTPHTFRQNPTQCYGS
ncbi:filamentous hemagglutinin N-terminal domain-containing protein [Nostoc sp. MG11]|uniref:two-partner secretion domain-containing protein n=1 Tax=Nostoc sp. MG11 TaxID=2721166 RepID=UPI0018683047|nr:filamentous hemagglutinin N-terminal domain-containing protein [Nostoc sp. MG11]